MQLRTSALYGVMLVLVAAGPAGAAPPTAGHLTCEYLTDPLGIDVAQPRLSWQITADQRGARQSAYEVQVESASSQSTDPSRPSVLWDSGKTQSDQSIQVEYRGRPLTSGQACTWKVRVWDETDHPSAWSGPSTWSMGLLKPTDWKGRWIGMAGAINAKKRPPASPLLRKTFGVVKPVRRATASVCGLGYFELYLNGAKVGDHVLDPPVSRYDRRDLYVTFDVTKQLAAGRNAVGVALGNGEYNVTVPDAWGFEKAPWVQQPQAIVQLDVQYTDGSHEQVVSDSSWKGATGPSTFDQMRVCENYDARLADPAWCTATFDDAAWTPVAVREGPGGVLHASDVEPIRVLDTLKPVKMTEPRPGVFMFDVGQNMTGWPQLTVTGPAGTAVRMSCGERLKPDGTLDNANIRQHEHGTHDFQADTYTLKGGGVEVWEPRFTFHGFQYVQVEGFPGTPTLDSIRARVVHTDFPKAGGFTCSNELFNRIERATVWSYISNFVGFPTDCPHREKNGWTGDAQLAVALGLEHFHTEAAYTRWLNDFDDAQRPDGKLPSIIPSAGWGYGNTDGPAWESAYFLIPWELYQQSGALRVLEQHYEGYKKWLGWYTARAKNHIVSYGLNDWEPAKTVTPANVTSTCYYFRGAQIIARTAKLLGRTDDAKTYQQLADDIAASFNATFFDDKTGEYAEGSQTALSAALYFGLVKEADRPRVVQNLVDSIARSNNHLDVGILGAKYLLRVLSDNGRADVAYQVANQTTAPSWGFWLEHGGTTLWENWGTTESHNHVMFGDITAWFIEYVAGIRSDPQAVGYKNVIVRPTLVGDLTTARATHDGLYGPIVSEWKRDGTRLTLNVTIPANSTATVYVPTTDAAAVTEGTALASKAVGVTARGTVDGAAIFTVGAGQYVFGSKVAEASTATTRP